MIYKSSPVAALGQNLRVHHLSGLKHGVVAAGVDQDAVALPVRSELLVAAAVVVLMSTVYLRLRN
jgi:hypothetical protein